MDRALDLKPEVTQGSPRLLPGRGTVGCPLIQVCALGWVKCREHISLLIILCIIVYVTNKAHPSLICIVLYKILDIDLIDFTGMYSSTPSPVMEFLFLFVTYTIIQNITSSEICALHLTHPKASVNAIE